MLLLLINTCPVSGTYVVIIASVTAIDTGSDTTSNITSDTTLVTLLHGNTASVTDSDSHNDTILVTH